MTIPAGNETTGIAKHIAVPVLALLMLPAASFAQPTADKITRGKYIVENVAMCGDCHTPRDAKGSLVMSQLLRGAPLGFRPVVTIPFADFAPSISGGPPGWTGAQLVHFLETGERPSHQAPLPSMPSYRLSPGDATAVALYLRSLK